MEAELNVSGLEFIYLLINTIDKCLEHFFKLISSKTSNLVHGNQQAFHKN